MDSCICWSVVTFYCFIGRSVENETQIGRANPIIFHFLVWLNLCWKVLRILCFHICSFTATTKELQLLCSPLPLPKNGNQPLCASLFNSNYLKINSQEGFAPCQQISIITDQQRWWKKLSTGEKKKSVIYMQCIYKGDLFNEDYALRNCYYFV